ncbi:DNA repair protein RecO [Olsenella sp. YH-ols2217]|uniref:DNA repair protein RecO n=1 Tax=Kribbibacterium absianum TaxID=3044210 RepID=A0ABT6ZIV7_9ACTN|nr:MULTISPECIES: DNA repair protein RecO [unclassified Olsenella]MDJ1121499.1 DNA repair protein RecO [Olsenella sp. YH-ols2216]MDJ1128989.1 DNA repair protein RecO [Olsenella sp. YH-ols2217]
MAGRNTYRTRALVLQHTRLSETDLILTLLRENGEQARAVAKGARKPGGRLASRVQLFSTIDVLLARGRSLDVVAEAALEDARPRLTGDLDKLSAGAAVLECARLTCYEDAPDPFLYPVTARTLDVMAGTDDPQSLAVLASAHLFKVLSHQGWRPETRSCVACGDEHPTRFSAIAGGALCESCARDVEGATPATENQLAWVDALVGARLDVLAGSACDVGTASWLATQAHLWGTTHLEARLKAWEFLLSL